MRHETAEMIRENIKNQEPFSHTSYRGQSRPDGSYELWHHDTRMAKFSADGDMEYFDVNYYSNTTSRFQGIIIRTLKKEDWDRVNEIHKGDKDVLKRISKLRY